MFKPSFPIAFLQLYRPTATDVVINTAKDSLTSIIQRYDLGALIVGSFLPALSFLSFEFYSIVVKRLSSFFKSIALTMILDIVERSVKSL